jgi:cytochrome c-type biogenesis protein CcsB
VACRHRLPTTVRRKSNMKNLCLPLLACLFAMATLARGQAAAPAAADPAFASKVDLSPVRTMTVQHAQTLKTFDSYARQTLELITGHGSFDGQDPVFTVLNMAFRPQDYASLNMIKIRNQPLRTEFRKLAFLADDEKERIVNTGMVSLELVGRPEVQNMLYAAQSSDVRKGQAVQQFYGAFQTMNQICSAVGGADLFVPVAVVPPVGGATQWQKVIDVAPADPKWVEINKSTGRPLPAVPAGYTADTVTPVVGDAVYLYAAWRAQDPRAVNEAAASLAKSVVAVNPAAYPSAIQRQVEVTYNRLAKMTLPGAACYFFAFVCFLASARSGLPSLRLWGLRLLTLGIAVHTLGIAVRWWLVGSIPIKNEFESVMFSAWFGVLVGFGLELGVIQSAVRGLASVAGVKMVAGSPIRSVFGTAASFVGWLSLIAIFTVPYVLGTSIGQEIGMANGVLYSYWLYIHVTMVTASYALIGMGFCLSVWWLVKYYADFGTLARLSPRQLEGEARGFDVVYPGGGNAAVAGGGALNLGATLARMAFFPVAEPAAPRVARSAAADGSVDAKVSFLSALDACNLVVLQLAFWVLGAGIVFGAIWADMSWGRPWGWDPKETFALITWIVYLIVVHVRVTTEHKAWWTAVLSTVGFFVMLFNWIGVNFFLHGLHSYA